MNPLVSQQFKYFGAGLRTGILVLSAFEALFFLNSAWAETSVTPPPIIMTGADRRPAISLNGEWGAIVDPYFSGLFSFHHQEKSNGWFLNRKAKPDDPYPTEYDFAKAPKLKVPGDWNTQRDSLLYYEGPVWYEHDFTYQPRENTKLFLHVGAANYRSWFWVNGKKVCQHEGGFTSFNCDVTQAVHAGDNFIVAAVDNTRIEDGVPGLETDWWNYGGLTRADISHRSSQCFHRPIRSPSSPRRRFQPSRDGFMWKARIAETRWKLKFLN